MSKCCVVLGRDALAVEIRDKVLELECEREISLAAWRSAQSAHKEFVDFPHALKFGRLDKFAAALVSSNVKKIAFVGEREPKDRTARLSNSVRNHALSTSHSFPDLIEGAIKEMDEHDVKVVKISDLFPEYSIERLASEPNKRHIELLNITANDQLWKSKSTFSVVAVFDDGIPICRGVQGQTDQILREAKRIPKNRRVNRVLVKFSRAETDIVMGNVIGLKTIANAARAKVNEILIEGNNSIVAKPSETKAIALAAKIRIFYLRPENH